MEKIIKVLLFLYLVFFPFGQLGRLPFKIDWLPEVNFYLTDIIVGLIGVIGLTRWALVGKKKNKLPFLARPMMAFLGVTAFSLIINIPFFEKRQILVGFFYWLRLAAYFGFYLAVNWFNWNSGSGFLKDGLLVVGGAIAAFGLIQYFFWPDLTALKYLNWDPHYYRLAGPFLDPNFSGIILVLSIFWLFSYPKLTIVHYSLFIVYYFALALTYSRASWLAFFGGMLTILIYKKKLKFLAVLVLIMVLSIFALPKKWGGEGVRLERTSSVFSRLESWQNALSIAKKHPFFGVGFNTYRYAQKKYGFVKGEEKWLVSHAGAGTDNSFLFVLATSGIFGLGIFIWLVGEVLRFSFRKSVFVFASVVAVLIHSFFNNTLFYPWVMGWLVIILETK